MEPVTVHTFADVDARDAHVIAAFPSVGLVATIAATYFVEELGLTQVGVVDSPRFPTISVVEKGEPLNPIRIYAGPGKVIVILSEFQPSPELVRPVTEAIIAWARQQGCASVVAPEGLLEDAGGVLRVAASTQAMRELLVAQEVPLFQEGIVAGVTGVMLNMGKRDQFPVVGVLSPAQQGQPDARSAAAVVEMVARLVGADIDTERLLREADAFDRHAEDAQRRVQLQGGETADVGMFG